jgi:hypothetical protein
LAELDSHLSKVKNDLSEENVKNAIINSFITIEDKLKEMALRSYKNNDGTLGYVGSCALVSLTINDKVYVANLGDSQGMIIGLLIS